MPYVRTLGTLGLGEANYGGNGFGNEEVTFDQCQAIINHQAPGGLETKYACASRGWWGNRPPPQGSAQQFTQQQPQQNPVLQIPQLQMAVQPTITQAPAQPLPPQVIIPPPPQLFEETVNTIPDCSGLDAWIADNKVLALGVAALIYFVR
jgi:hypothetical protein